MIAATCLAPPPHLVECKAKDVRYSHNCMLGRARASQVDWQAIHVHHLSQGRVGELHWGPGLRAQGWGSLGVSDHTGIRLLQTTPPTTPLTSQHAFDAISCSCLTHRCGNGLSTLTTAQAATALRATANRLQPLQPPEAPLEPHNQFYLPATYNTQKPVVAWDSSRRVVGWCACCDDGVTWTASG